MSRDMAISYAIEITKSIVGNTSTALTTESATNIAAFIRTLADELET